MKATFNKSHQQFFESAKSNDALRLVFDSADALADKQRNDKERYLKVKINGFADKMLIDISRYRKGGKFITPYHAQLYKKRNNSDFIGCPIVEIGLQQQEQDIKNKEYFSKVYSSNNNFRIRKKRLNLLNYNNALSLFINDYLMPAFIGRGISYELDEINEPIIRDLVSYFTRQEDCTLDINKGVCLMGNVGTGKSTIMREMARFTKDTSLETQFFFISMDKIYTDCDSKGLESLSDYEFKTVAFDDIGMRAENNVNNFGTKINAYQELVRRQYNRYTRPNPSLSHYTSNLPYNTRDKDNINKLVGMFGARELDRFREMSNFISLNGKSRRKF